MATGRNATKSDSHSMRAQPVQAGEKELVSPEILKAMGRQGRVADRGHDRSVAEISLDGASVVAVIGELEAAGMPEHVGVNEEGEFRSHARPGNHALISGLRARRITVGNQRTTLVRHTSLKRTGLNSV